MSFSSLTAAAKSARLKVGLWAVFMVSIGSCVQAQIKKPAKADAKGIVETGGNGPAGRIQLTDQTPLAPTPNIIHDAQGDIFKSVEQSAEFPGGLNALYKYMGKNLRYPEAARKNDVQGKVFVTFVIEKNGLVSNVKIIRGIGHGCDEEAVRVIKASPKWKPGMQNKRPVRQQYTLPINFALADK